MPDQTLDTKGLNCPLPILKAKKSISQMESGQTLEVLSTDPGSVLDFEALCRQPAMNYWNQRKRMAFLFFC